MNTEIIDDLVKVGFEPEFDNFLEAFCIDIVCLKRIEDIINKHAKRIPFDVILEIYTKGYHYQHFSDIESFYEVPGFNAWYLKTYGKTVEEAE